MPLISLDESCLITYESCHTPSRAIKDSESQPYTHLYMHTLVHVNTNMQANTNLLEEESQLQQPTAAHSFSVSSVSRYKLSKEFSHKRALLHIKRALLYISITCIKGAVTPSSLLTRLLAIHCICVYVYIQVCTCVCVCVLSTYRVFETQM